MAVDFASNDTGPELLGKLDALAGEVIANTAAVAGKAPTGALTNETNARIAADATESAARIAADSNEATIRAAAITAANAARATGDANEAAARIAADTAETAARQAADTTEANARTAADAVRPTYAESALEAFRPGEVNRFFTTVTTGAPSAVQMLPDAAKLISLTGAVAVVDGAGIIAPIETITIEPGRQYRGRFAVQRAVDTEDPNNDAIRFGIQWMRADYTPVSISILEDVKNFTVASGRVVFTYNFAAESANNIDAVRPAGAARARLFVRTFGAGRTYVDVIKVSDLSDSVDWSPDVSAFERELAGYNYRLEDFSTRLSVNETDIVASRNAAWFTSGTIADARLSTRVVFRDVDEVIGGSWRHDAAVRMRAPVLIGDAQATGGGPTARIVHDGNYFAIAPTNKAGGLDTLKELSFNPDAVDAADRVWTAEGGFKTTGALTVVGAGSFSDAATTRNNLDVYNKAYVDALIDARDVMQYKGGINASSNPNYPAASAGWAYRITTAGKIGGASGIDVEKDDLLICTIDGTPAGDHATVGANWAINERNIVLPLKAADIGVTVQGFDSDLAAIAALTTTSFGRSFLTFADVAAFKTATNLVIGADVQAYDADLAAIAALTTTGFGRSALAVADAVAERVRIGAVIGTDVQAFDSDLAAIAALTTTSFGRSFLTLADAAAALTLTGAQPSDSDLTAIAALTTTSYGRSLLTLADAAAALTAIGAQPVDADLTAIAALTTTTYGRSLLAMADAVAVATSINAPRIIYSNAVQVAQTGTTALTVMRSFTLPGGTLGPNGHLEAHLLWSFGNGGANAASTVVGYRIGGTNVVSTTVITSTRSLSRVGMLRARNAQNSQVVYPVTGGADPGVSTGNASALAIDLSVNQTVEMFITLGNSADTAWLEAVTFKACYGA